MKYIPAYILEKIERREIRKREELRQRLPLPRPLPLPLQKEPETEEEKKEDCIIIEMGAGK